MLRAMGADLKLDPSGWYHLSPVSSLRAIDVDVPGDLSSAAFFLVAGAIVSGSEITLREVGVNPTRAGVIDALRTMGARIEVTPLDRAGAEPIADITVSSGGLRGCEIGGDLALRCLDELPVLAVAAAFADGVTIISDAEELRVKESDRIARVVAGLRAFGVKVEERPDGMVIEGGSPKGPATIDARGDHRIAMAFAVCAHACDGGARIAGAESIATSYPSFLADLEALGV
jgi:3-phosphoshikimate 1-carboxyvinyltransferase